LQGFEDFERFSDEWFIFLTAWKSVYTTLEQGAKVSPQSRQWFGGKKTERRDDPLLNYLFQARNDEEHGLSPGLRAGAIDVMFGLPDGGLPVPEGTPDAEITVTAQQVGGMMVVRATRSDGGPIEVRNSRGPHIRLEDATTRDGKKAYAPIGHKGKRLDDYTPRGVARVGLDYLTALVREAEALVIP
jgi:hypothetical protein